MDFTTRTEDPADVGIRLTNRVAHCRAALYALDGDTPDVNPADVQWALRDLLGKLEGELHGRFTEWSNERRAASRDSAA